MAKAQINFDSLGGGGVNIDLTPYHVDATDIGGGQFQFTESRTVVLIIASYMDSRHICSVTRKDMTGYYGAPSNFAEDANYTFTQTGSTVVAMSGWNQNPTSVIYFVEAE